MLNDPLRRRRLLAFTALSAAAMVATAPAQAQRVTRIVAFGDSYADTGNLFRLIGTNPSPQVYPTGRFSGGTNYIDSLGQVLGVPQVNFAIGGATTSNVNVAAPGPLGFQTEYSSFLAGGGTAFPAITPRFTASDLLAVSIGGNDARAYQQGGGTVLGAPVAAAVAVTNATTGLNALVGAGARNIDFLAGNTAALPEVATNAAAQGVRNAYSTAFNAGIQTTLAGYANQGVIVNYTDLALIGNRIIANPAAYGLTSAGACPVTCISNPVSQGQYLFYVDQLHLTSAGFLIVSNYIRRQMQAPLTLQAASDVGIDTAHQFGRTLSTRMDVGSPRDGDQLTGVRLFVTGDTFTRKAGVSDTNEAFKVTSVGATVGVEAGFGGGTVGIAANYSKPRARFYNDSNSIRGRSYQVGAFAGVGIAGGFAQGYLGYGKDKHSIYRTGVIDDLRARPSGSHWLAGVKAGYLAGFGTVRIGPVVALDAAHAKVDGYTESGDPALALNVQSQRFSSARGSAGLEMRGDIDAGGLHFRPIASLVAEREFRRDGRTFFYSETAAPTIVNRFSIGEANRKKTYARAMIGGNAELAKGVSIDAGINATFGKKQGNDTSGVVGLNFGF